LGYLIVPPHLAEAFAVARVLATIGGTKYVQATLADFVAEGHFVRHVRRVTRLYSERRRAWSRSSTRACPRNATRCAWETSDCTSRPLSAINAQSRAAQRFRPIAEGRVSRSGQKAQESVPGGKALRNEAPGLRAEP
jgi:hypothetical protein